MTSPAPSRIKLTKRAVDALAPNHKDQVIFDAELPGFGLKITPSGRKVFLVQYRYPPGRAGRVRRYTIGAYGEGLTPDQARGIALQVKGRLAAGVDPVSERETVLEEATRVAQEKKLKQANTVKGVATIFIERHAKPRLRSWREYERMLKDYVLPDWGSRPITEIKRSDVTALLDSVEEKRSAALADHVLAVIRKMFNWHAARDENFLSPLVKGMARTSHSARARDRILNDEEVRTLWQTLERTPYPFGPFVQLLLLTAQRRDEIAHMRWAEIENDLWVIPRERYKSGKANAVPLGECALSILSTLPRTSEYVFTTTGRTPISGFSKAKTAIDKATHLEGWRLHDLRRTARSLMSRAGVGNDIAERVLGHAIPGIAGVYDRHNYIQEKREAITKLEELIANILSHRRSLSTK